jgi:hypothetical protein
MFQNRIRRSAPGWDTYDALSPSIVPAGFVLMPIHHFPSAVQRMIAFSGEVYRIAYEQARLSAELAEIDPEWFTP